MPVLKPDRMYLQHYDREEWLGNCSFKNGKSSVDSVRRITKCLVQEQFCAIITHMIPETFQSFYPFIHMH